MLEKIYDSTSIKVLKGLDAVRKRPGMYIGDTYDGSGLHHMIFEVLDNSIDEALSGYCKNIYVKIHLDNSISILDDGRGIPVDVYKKENITTAELIMTVLHAGGKFDNKAYKISGGLHGVGVSVVNALSSKLKLKIYKNNRIYLQIYKYGKPLEKLNIIGKTKLNGTYIRFWPDLNIFKGCTNFNYSIIYKRLNELSFLNNGLKIYLSDISIKKFIKFENKGGLKSFLVFLIKDKILLNNNYFYFIKKKNNITLEVCCGWVNSIKSNILCFTNNIPQIDGGTHLMGFKRSVTRTINSYINNEYLRNKKQKFNVIGKDIREGLYAIISIKIPNPKFSSQTKDKLISSEVRILVENLVSKYLFDYLLENPNETKLILNKIINSYKTRLSIKKLREIAKKKYNFDLTNISNKLADCQEKNPLYSEIFLVEGDSAGGSAKQGRNRINQAILPLKGKIINVEKNSLDKILSSSEINILISVLGCGFKDNNFDINKLRYNKVIIMTDADVDGAHIRTLLLTFFYKYMKKLIIKGHLYVANPPLYRLQTKKFNYYLNNERDLLKYKIIFSFYKINIYDQTEKLVIFYKDLIKIILMYIKILGNLKFNLKSFLLDNLMIFKLFNYKDLLKNKLWLINFVKFLNKDSLYKIKAIIIYNNKKFYGIKFFIKEDFKYKKIILDLFFFKNIYKKLMKLSKKLYFLYLRLKKVYFNLNKKKYYFNYLSDLIKKVLNIKSKKMYIQRYKGLGEMNPNQLWKTTMNPNNRFLSKIYVKDFNKADILFKTLMGDNVILRKQFIKKYSIKNIII